MPRRVSLPGASELFRRTEDGPAEQPPPAAPTGRGTGRVRHEEKITVYVSRDELLALEQARLTLRRSGLAVDRGRIVREALAWVLDDLQQHGGDSELLRRLGATADPAAPTPDQPAPDPAL